MIYDCDYLTFQVQAIARMPHTEGYFKVKKRPYGAISYKISGTSEFEIDGKKLFVKPKDILFIPANTDYTAKYSVNDSIIIHVTDCNYTSPECICVENKELVEYLFFNLLTLWEKNHSVNQAKSCIYDIFYKILGEHLSYNPTFKNMLEYINKHFCDADLSISNVCCKYYISKSTAQRLFLKNTGISPKQYLLKLRMEKAMFLLAEGDLLIKDIALQCGFKDEKYFSKIFQEKIGCPPSQLYKHHIR